MNFTTVEVNTKIYYSIFCVECCMIYSIACLAPFMYINKHKQKFLVGSNMLNGLLMV